MEPVQKYEQEATLVVAEKNKIGSTKVYGENGPLRCNVNTFLMSFSFNNLNNSFVDFGPDGRLKLHICAYLVSTTHKCKYAMSWFYSHSFSCWPRPDSGHPTCKGSGVHFV